MVQKLNHIMKLSIFINSDNNELKQMYKNHAILHNEKIYVDTFPDTGFDLFTPSSIVFHNDVNKVNFQVCCSATIDYGNKYSYKTGYYLYPLSSLSKKPIRMVNSIRIVDNRFRGDLVGLFICNSDYTVHSYNKLAQICAPGLIPIFVTVVDNLEDLYNSITFPKKLIT